MRLKGLLFRELRFYCTAADPVGNELPRRPATHCADAVLVNGKSTTEAYKSSEWGAEDLYFIYEKERTGKKKNRKNEKGV